MGNITNAQAIDIMLGLADPVSYIAIKSAKALLSNPAKRATQYMYHWTTLENWNSIQKHGLLTNQSSTFLRSGKRLMREIYGCIPICLSTKRNGEYSMGHGVFIRVDVTGLNLCADVFSMIGYSIMKPDEIWLNYELSGFANKTSIDDLKYIAKNRVKECIKLTQTACVTSNISPDRITVLEIRI